MSKLSAYFHNSGMVTKIVMYSMAATFFSGLAQHVIANNDTTSVMLENFKQSAEEYCTLNEFEQYALKRIIEEGITPHHVKIEC